MRCAQKGLECMYDLEPLSAPVGKTDQLPVFTFNPSTCNSPGYCVFKPLSFRDPGIDPAICSPRHEDNLEIIIQGYQSVPGLISEGKPALFIHPKLRMHNNYIHSAIFGEPAENYTSYECLKRLAQTKFDTLPAEDALTALQALIIYLATLLFSSDSLLQEGAEKYVNVMYGWTQVILDSAQAKTPRKSPWQEWLFGESVRRTIFMSYGLIMALSSFKYGYCSNWLFLESLPFDKRAGLWMAESPQAWIAAAGANNGEEVGEQLHSFHGFAEDMKGSHRNFCDDRFLVLLECVHNGVTKE